MTPVDDREDAPTTVDPAESVERPDAESEPSRATPLDRTYVSTLDPDVAPSVGVVRTIASLAGDDAIELPSLYDSIDPDALDSLFDHADRQDGASVRLSFSYAAHRVTVCADGTIEAESETVAPTCPDDG